jgi:hypothetical protein
LLLQFAGGDLRISHRLETRKKSLVILVVRWGFGNAIAKAGKLLEENWVYHSSGIVREPSSL